MANKRQRKKRGQLIPAKDQAKVMRETAINTYLRDLITEPIAKERVVQPQRELEKNVRKMLKVMRQSGLIRKSRMTAGLEYLGSALQHQGALMSKMQKLNEGYAGLRNEQVSLRKELNMSPADVKAARIYRKEKLETLQKKITDMTNYIDSLKAQGKIPTRKQLEPLAELMTERLFTMQELSILDSHDFNYEKSPYMGDVDSATYWAAIKRYNELLKEGAVPALNGLDKYESAEWAMDYLPYDEVMEVLRDADKKRQILIEKHSDMTRFDRPELAGKTVGSGKMSIKFF